MWVILYTEPKFVGLHRSKFHSLFKYNNHKKISVVLIDGNQRSKCLVVTTTERNELFSQLTGISLSMRSFYTLFEMFPIK